MRRGRSGTGAARVALRLAVAFGLIATGCLGLDRTRPAHDAAESLTTLGTQAECRPEFPDEDGWFGGDSAASAPLPGQDGRASLWLFGDSFVARTRRRAGREFPFVHNSVAIAHCDEGGGWRLDYAFRRASDGVPRAFFEPPPETSPIGEHASAGDGDAYYWPIGAAARGRFVYVALLRVEPGPPAGPFQLPFRLVGVDLARVEPSNAAPTRWPIRYATLSRRKDVFPAASLVSTPDALHAFAFLAPEDGRAPRILMRIPEAALAEHAPDFPSSLEASLETLGEHGRFTRGLAPDAARILMDDDATEMSVHFDPGLGEWLAVYADPTGTDGAARGDVVWLRRAPALTGPWSAPRPLLRIPELLGGPDPEPGERFCYAGKAHPELAPSGSLLVTWVCNLFAEPGEDVGAVLERLRTTPSLYRPRALRIAVPAHAAPDAR